MHPNQDHILKGLYAILTLTDFLSKELDQYFTHPREIEFLDGLSDGIKVQWQDAADTYFKVIGIYDQAPYTYFTYVKWIQVTYRVSIEHEIMEIPVKSLTDIIQEYKRFMNEQANTLP